MTQRRFFPHHNGRARGQRGFTLIELMVGLAIGLLTTAVIAQILVLSEDRRRATVTGTDAQVNGALSMYTLQRDVQMAGYGLTSLIQGLGCPIRAQRDEGGGVSQTRTFTLAPIVITDGGVAGEPDSLLVMSSAKRSFSVPARVIIDHPSTAANFFVNSTVGVEDGDLMIAVPNVIDANNWCSLFNVTGTGGAPGQGMGQGQNQVLHNAGVGGEWNQPGGQTIFPAAGYPAGSSVVNLGQFVERTYSVTSSQTLQLATYSTSAAQTTTQALFPDIVNLQAYYGKDTNGDGVVDTYDSVTPATGSAWQQVRTVRLAVVARSVQMAKENVTDGQPLWEVGTAALVAGSVACGTSRCVTLKVDGLPDWQRYRYKVFDSVVPLRNMLWRS